MPARKPLARRPLRGDAILVELVRLAVVVLATATAFELGQSLAANDLGVDRQALSLSVTVVGAGLGYVGGGILGRAALGRVDAVERQLAHVSAGELLAAMLGGFGGLFIGLGLAWPALLFDAKTITIPLAVLVTILFVAVGARVGFRRGGDLLRFMGASGRLSVAIPSRGATAKLVDTSALVDGRVLDVCRTGFLEGTLVVPRFVLYELQGLADSGDEERRVRGRRGLDVLAALQRSSGIALEVSEDDVVDVEAVDAKLVSLAKKRGAALVTTDGNLARAAEIQGVHVRNLNVLAETLRPPVLPGDVISVRVVKVGTEPGQGVGYLADGTMVVVEGAKDRVGRDAAAEVTSIVSNPRGRMVFASVTDAEPLSRRAAV